MTIENRLAQMKKYLEEALLDPVSNKLYIEDLKLSIKTFERMKPLNNFTLTQYKDGKANTYQIMNGFAIDS